MVPNVSNLRTAHGVKRLRLGRCSLLDPIRTFLNGSQTRLLQQPVKVNEMIIISLFDEVEFDDRSSGGYLDDESAIRREKHFLGSVVLPFQVMVLHNVASPPLRLSGIHAPWSSRFPIELWLVQLEDGRSMLVI